MIQPCSVIKELVENSFDAGATRVEVEIDGSGADGIRISDNGMGMDEEDLLLCVEPHATSKIENATDLYRTLSCGFRGEALASIAEVSRLDMTSRPAEGEHANKLIRDKKGQYVLEGASRGQGTSVSMRDLFYNVPVRRRFLKSDRAENTQNLEVLKKLALARPWVGMKVMRDGLINFDLPEDQDLEARIRGLGLFDVKTKLKAMQHESENAKLEGMITLPPEHFGTPGKIWLFVNRRPFNDRALVRAIQQGFSSFVPERRYPGAVLFIQCPAEEVDVNIHPTKSEVRFRHPEDMFRLVMRGMREALSDQSAAVHEEDAQMVVYKKSGVAKAVPVPTVSRTHAPQSDPWKKPLWESDRDFSYGSSKSARSADLGETEQRFFSPSDPTSVHQEAPQACERGSANLRSSQWLQRFIVVETAQGLEIADQHALHERILFNQLRQADKSALFCTQSLLAPITLAFPSELQEFSKETIAELEKGGFSLELRDSELCIHGIPDYLNPEKACAVMEGVMADLCQGVPPSLEELRRLILATLACRAAVKAGDVLEGEEIQRLVLFWHLMDESQECCPHGRSSIWRLSIEELNSFFDR